MANSNVPQYPAMFDPSQLSNKYSSMNASTFPMYNYYGTPTDAMGKPISSYKPPAPAPAAPTPGITLNSSPQSPQGYWQQTSPGGMLPSGQNYGSEHPTYIQPTMQWMPAQQQQQAAAPAAPQDLSQNAGFQYLLAMAHPDKVQTPGITPPPRASQPGNFDIDSLIAQLRGQQMAPPQSQTGIIQGTAPSNGFLQTLAALRAGAPGAK